MAAPTIYRPELGNSAPSVSGSVANKGNTQLNTVSSTPPPGYYVIVGCGPAAMINHTTLRQSKAGRERLKLKSGDTSELPVVHVGHEDPWGHYSRHGMGQLPYLLRMPGYHSPIPPNPDAIDLRLSSVVFAQSTADERTSLQTLPGLPGAQTVGVRISWLEGWVAGIESRDKRFGDKLKKGLSDLAGAVVSQSAFFDDAFKSDYPEGYLPYRLLVVDPDAKLWWVYAHKIDICSGGGVNRVVPRWAEPDPSFFKRANRAPWIPFKNLNKAGLDTRPVISGVDGLAKETVWQPLTRVCVVGPGGIALNQIERCKLNDPNSDQWLLDWVSHKTLLESFPLTTNDPVLMAQPCTWRDGALDQMAAGGADAMRKAEKTFLYVPGSKAWRFAIYTQFVGGTVSNKVTATFAPSTEKEAGDPTLWDAFPKLFKEVKHGQPFPPQAQTLVAGKFPYDVPYFAHVPNHRIASNYPANVYQRVILCFGQDQQEPGEPAPIASAYKFEPIQFKSRCAGWKSAGGGDIRILGAAGLMLPAVLKEDNGDVKKRTDTYHLSLPLSAVVPGFIRAGCAIASANGYFGEKDRVNANVNSASMEELTDALNGVPNAGKIAENICAARAKSVHGFASLDELATVVGDDWKSVGQQIKAALKTDYEAALPWEQCYPPSKST